MDIDVKNFVVDDLSYEQLVYLIEYHNRCYWENGAPEISDELYDDLIRALGAINPDHQLIHAVNAPLVASSGKVTHRVPMLSLDKAYSLEEVLTWAAKYVRSQEELLLVQPKYDGISANYQGGVLATRGDGVEGENITAKLPLIELETTGYKGPVNRNVRGEIVIRDDDFRTIYADITKKGGGQYKNSRNAVAGIMGLKEIDDMVAQGAKLTLVDYEMISYNVTFKEFPERWAGIVEEIEALPYPMDGIVVKLADEQYAVELGTTAHHPRGQIAFKFSGIRKQTKLLGVEWSFGKNCLTPVAKLEPVDIGGITIRHATLHNAQNVIDKDIHIGDTVTVERAGDVIPYIVSAEPGETRESCLIEHCPCCGSQLERSGPELCCPNEDCFETRLQRLTAAVKSIGIERLGEPNIRRMMTMLGVKTLKDIFDLTLMDILKLDGFQAKSANNLFREIAKARNVNDYQLLAALNIPGIGPNVAKVLLAQYSLEELRNLSEEELAEINGIGPERASAIRSMLAAQADFINEMLECVNVISSKGGATRPTICFTGKMPEKRSYYENLAESRGFSPVSTVNSELAVLVAADPGASGGKLTKARNAGVKIVALDDWLNEQDSTEPAGTTEDDLFANFEPPAEEVAPEEEKTDEIKTQGLLGL